MCWLPAVCVSWGSFCLGSLSLTEDSNIIWGGATIRIDYWLACQEVLLMRGVLVLELPLMPPFPESWQGVDYCRIFPSILSCCSILSSFVSVTLLSPHLTIRFPTISLLSKVFPPGFPILGQCIPDMVLQAFGFHPSGKGTHLITLDALYRHTPISRNFRAWCSWFGIVCPLVQMLWLDQLLASANPARRRGAFVVFAVFITSDLGSKFHTGSIYFQTPQQCFLSEGDCFLCSPDPCFICCVVKFVSVSRLNCCKYKSPDTNGFVADRCSFSLLFEIIPSESHCYLRYWHTL